MGMFTFAPRCNSVHTVRRPAHEWAKVKVSLRWTINWPASLGLVNYLHAQGYAIDTNEPIFDKYEVWSIPLRNEHCLNRLAKDILSNAVDREHMVKVELFDPDTHELLATAVKEW